MGFAPWISVSVKSGGQKKRKVHDWGDITLDNDESLIEQVAAIELQKQASERAREV